VLIATKLLSSLGVDNLENQFVSKVFRFKQKTFEKISSYFSNKYEKIALFV